MSLTITEGAYGLDHVTGKFSGANELIAADLRAEQPSGSWLGLLLLALRRRRAEGTGGLTIMACNNIQEDGVAARTALLALAQMKDPDMVSWIEEDLSFPNSTVDRVTPGTVDADRDHLENTFGYRDRWPVTCEPFSQWVLKDAFVKGRPALQDAGVDVVADVEPYELMKLRLANGTHQVLCYFGHLLGYHYDHWGNSRPGHPRTAVALHRRGVGPVPQTHPWRRPQQMGPHRARTLRKPPDTRPPRPNLRRHLGPHPQVPATRRLFAAQERRFCRGRRCDRGQLGTLRRRR